MVFGEFYNTDITLNIYEARGLLLGRHGGRVSSSLEIKRHAALVTVLFLLRDTVTTATLKIESINWGLLAASDV